MKAGFTADTVNRVLHNVIRYGFTATEPLQVGGTPIIPVHYRTLVLSSLAICS
jgi:hypothetical protein